MRDEQELTKQKEKTTQREEMFMQRHGWEQQKIGQKRDDRSGSKDGEP